MIEKILISLASLLLLLSHEAAALPVECRGVMESILVHASSRESIISRLDFYAENGFNTYFYAPEDDPYRGSEGWKYLYPDPDIARMEFVWNACQKRGLDFIWTVDPGNDYRWNEDDYKLLLNKLVLMYYKGLRTFAVSFRSADAKVATSERQREVYDRLVTDFVAKRKEPVRLILVDGLSLVDHPVPGSDAMTLIQGIEFDEATCSKAVSSGSLVCNILEWSELSKFAIISIAECAADPSSYDAGRSRMRAIETLAPEVKDAYLTFVKHSGGVSESSDIETFTLFGYTREKYDALMDEFIRIENVPEVMESCASRTMLDQLRPWLIEFGRLGTRGRKALECLSFYLQGDLGAFWNAYVYNQMSPEEIRSYQAHKTGSMKLQPFYEDMMRDLSKAFSIRLTGSEELKNLSSDASSSVRKALDSDFSTCVASKGQTVFAIPAKAARCHLLLGDLPEGEMLFFRQIAADGSLIAEFVITSPYMVMDIKDRAVKVDVLGNVDIFETIFVSL